MSSTKTPFTSSNRDQWTDDKSEQWIGSLLREWAIKAYYTTRDTSLYFISAGEKLYYTTIDSILHRLARRK